MIKEINIEGESLKSQYFVCSTGKIFRWKKGQMAEVKGWLEHSRPGYEKRYWRVRIGKKKYYKHRLILSTFDRMPNPGEQARHLNDNEHDNRWPENLKWGSAAENTEDRIRNSETKIQNEQPKENLISEAYGPEEENEQPTEAPF